MATVEDMLREYMKNELHALELRAELARRQTQFDDDIFDEYGLPMARPLENYHDPDKASR